MANIIKPLPIKLKYNISFIKTAISSLATRESIDKYLEIPMLFIYGTGRSGTTFMAKIFEGIPNLCSFHEPLPYEGFAHSEAAIRPKSAARYVSAFKRFDVANRIKKHKCSNYIESNGYIRLHIPFMRKFFPNAHFLHLVRNPKDVIRSHMNRNVLLDPHPIYPSSWGPPHGISSENWREMDRFEKLCWLWSNENSTMRENADKTVLFEKIIGDYDYFKEFILNRITVDISKQKWEAMAKTPVNISASYSFPEYPEWDEIHKRKFAALCGDEMTQYGYVL